MFESLQENLSSAIKTLRGRGRLTESNMREGLALVQRALLEADVSIEVAKDFVAKVSEQAVGETVLKAIDPTHQLVAIVHKELVNLMGPIDHSLHLKPELTVLMLCGLQGSGKTTTCGKLGKLIQQRGRKPMLVAADLQRPAAIQQLQVLGQQLDIPVYADLAAKDPVALCQIAVKQAKEIGVQVVILDTAGRLHVDEELMGQLTQIDRRIGPDQVFLVVDSMTGQDAVRSAKAFNEALELDGVIMTKLDGDARGGAALSVKAVTGVPIKFIGTGEHLDALEEFHPDRLAGRILGMGDVLSLVEQAQQKFDQEEMAKAEAKLRKGEFTLDDFKKQLGQIGKLGPIQKVMSMIPGMGGMSKMLERPEPRVRPSPAGGHHRFDDARRAPQSVEDGRSEPPPPHRRGGRRRAAHGQQPGQAVRRHRRPDEEVVEHGHDGTHEDHAPVGLQRDAQSERQDRQSVCRHRQAPDFGRAGQAEENA